MFWLGSWKGIGHVNIIQFSIIIVIIVEVVMVVVAVVIWLGLVMGMLLDFGLVLVFDYKYIRYTNRYAVLAWSWLLTINFNDFNNTIFLQMNIS